MLESYHSISPRTKAKVKARLDEEILRRSPNEKLKTVVFMMAFLLNSMAAVHHNSGLSGVLLHIAVCWGIVYINKYFAAFAILARLEEESDQE